MCQDQFYIIFIRLKREKLFGNYIEIIYFRLLFSIRVLKLDKINDHCIRRLKKKK